MLLAAAALLLFIVVAARGESPVPTNVPADIPERGSLPIAGMGSGGDGTGTGPPGDPAVVGYTVGAVAALFLLVALVMAILNARQRRLLVRVGELTDRVEGAVELISRPQVVRAVTDAQELLARAGGRPGDAVIQAWLILEQATEDGRAPHETPTEFTVAMLEREAADPEALRRLLVLYQRARFGPAGETTDDDVDSARAALDRILVTVR